MSDERDGRSRPDDTRPYSLDGDDLGGRGDDQTRIQAPGEAAWSGRAEVPPPRPQEYVETDWATPEREPGGSWWMPILVGIIILILLALLGWGIWLIIQAQEKNNQAPAPTPTPPTPATTSPSATPTTTPPTTQATTTSPAPTAVTIPALRGLSQSEAQKALSRVDLASRLRYVATDQAPAGTVIDSDPSEGKQVPPGTTVTLIIAARPGTPPTPTPSIVITLPGG